MAGGSFNGHPPTPVDVLIERVTQTAPFTEDKQRCGSTDSLIYDAFQPLSLRDLVVRVIAPDHGGSFSLAQASDVFDHFVDWKYINDPIGEDYVDSPSNAWSLKSGDCDDRAVALAAALVAIGAEVRLVAEQTEAGAWHLFPELKLSAKKLPAYESYLIRRYGLGQRWRAAYQYQDEETIWLNLDWSATHPGGAYVGAGLGYYLDPVAHYCTPFDRRTISHLR